MSKLIVAETIVAQLGGRRFAAMVGAKNFIGSETGVSFKIGKNAKQVNTVSIEYNRGSDLYTMSFLRVSKRKDGIERKELLRFEDVYAEDLTNLFETATGLYTAF